jgi:secretory phospholipase A2
MATTNCRLKHVFFVVIGVLSIVLRKSVVNCDPSPFELPPSLQWKFPKLPTFQEFIEKRQISAMKTYSGRRLAVDSLRMIYYNDQTVAIIELGPEKMLISCELIEIYNDNEGKVLLKKLSRINRPLAIGFIDMLKLMQQCDEVDKNREQMKSQELVPFYQKQTASRDGAEINEASRDDSGGAGFQNPLSLFSGVFPGTKWCGTGDIAKNYHDLGTEKQMDRCCRQHDICPVKIRAYQTRYDLTNNSLYTKSHCTCDDLLFACLKATNTSASQLMGNIYFNLVQVPCIVENREGKVTFRGSREGF